MAAHMYMENTEQHNSKGKNKMPTYIDQGQYTTSRCNISDIICKANG